MLRRSDIVLDRTAKQVFEHLGNGTQVTPTAMEDR